ncbi:MAG: AraC family transcriptional regulator [Flaviaesturariibacter sp.]|nr:AraC family transcriptional regulator [Flaviaesturariibacter sp.]
MQHVEFFHRDHFETRYHRRPARRALGHFIDFFWEIDFDPLWGKYPEGFSDALFPNVGYTYMINLGTPFVMELGTNRHDVRSDVFLPRNKYMICHHAVGNRIFGIKFRVSPVVFEKKVNFSEYREYLYPLAYLIDRSVVDRVKAASGFDARVGIISDYYNRILERHLGSQRPVEIVTQVLKECGESNAFSVPVDALAARFGISGRTLQRYFEATTSIGSKQALQILRIRKAVEQLVNDPVGFHYSTYGYYDHSHFYRHLRGFLNQHTIDLLQPHLLLLTEASAKRKRIVNGES